MFMKVKLIMLKENSARLANDSFILYSVFTIIESKTPGCFTVAIYRHLE